MRIVVNPQVVNLKESATLAINQEAKKIRQEGKEIYHFGFGESPFPVPKPLSQALQENVEKKEYLPTQGLPTLCDAVAKYYQKAHNYQFDAGNVVIGPGSKELIFQLLYILEGPLMIPAPSWVSYGPQAAVRGKELVPILTKRENGYKLQADELEEACFRYGYQQKILILNSPNNPTGACYTDEEVRELAQICEAYNVVVISDEIYGLINFSGKPLASIYQYYPQGTIITGGLSKGFSAGGYRLGVMLIPPKLSDALIALKSLISETFSAVSAPIQYAAVSAYGDFELYEETLKQCCDIHQFAGEYLHKRFLGMGLNCPKPEGAFYLFPDFEHFRKKLKEKGIFTGKQLSQTLLEEIHVAVLPGIDFCMPATNLGVRVASVDYDGKLVLDEFPGLDQMTSEKTIELFPNLVKGCDSLEKFLGKF